LNLTQDEAVRNLKDMMADVVMTNQTHESEKRSLRKELAGLKALISCSDEQFMKSSLTFQETLSVLLDTVVARNGETEVN